MDSIYVRTMVDGEWLDVGTEFLASESEGGVVYGARRESITRNTV